MNKNRGSGCDGRPYLVMSQTVSLRVQHYHTAGKAAFPVSFHLSPTVSIQPSIFVLISPCHLSLTLKFIYALSFSYLFVLSLCFLLFYLSIPSTYLDRHQFSFVFLCNFSSCYILAVASSAGVNGL